MVVENANMNCELQLLFAPLLFQFGLDELFGSTPRTRPSPAHLQAKHTCQISPDTQTKYLDLLLFVIWFAFEHFEK